MKTCRFTFSKAGFPKKEKLAHHSSVVAGSPSFLSKNRNWSQSRSGPQKSSKKCTLGKSTSDPKMNLNGGKLEAPGSLHHVVFADFWGTSPSGLSQNRGVYTYLLPIYGYNGANEYTIIYTWNKVRNAWDKNRGLLELKLSYLQGITCPLAGVRRIYCRCPQRMGWFTGHQKLVPILESKF